MGRADYLDLGSWNAVCYFCGKKRKAEDLRKYWQGFYVCKEEWESRQPQDFAKGVPDNQTPPWTQPPPGDVFVEVCTPNGMSAIPDVAVPDCAIPDYVSPSYDPSVT